jgi:di/tricarboxylate transporter
MDSLDPLGRLLIIAGIILGGLGLLIVLAPNLPALGRLPGDIHIDRGNVQVFIPFGTMIVVSIVLTVLLNVFGFFGRNR